jgi:hypothetical protein
MELESIEPVMAGFEFAFADVVMYPRSGAETLFCAALRDGAVGAAIFIGSTFGCRAFTLVCCSEGGCVKVVCVLFGLLFDALLFAPAAGACAPGFFSAGLFAPDLLVAELFAEEFPAL